MPEIVLQVDDLPCRHCLRALTARLRDVGGVGVVTVDPGSGSLRLSGAMELDDVRAVLAGTRCTARPAPDSDGTGPGQRRP